MRGLRRAGLLRGGWGSREGGEVLLEASRLAGRSLARLGGVLGLGYLGIFGKYRNLGAGEL